MSNFIGTQQNSLASGGAPQQMQGSQQAGIEKPDWLDKGIAMAGKKAGVNISGANADKVGDFLNKQFKQSEGKGIPGVH